MSYAIASVNPSLDSQFILNWDPPPNTIPKHHCAFLLIIIRLRKLKQLLRNIFLYMCFMMATALPQWWFCKMFKIAEIGWGFSSWQNLSFSKPNIALNKIYIMDWQDKPCHVQKEYSITLKFALILLRYKSKCLAAADKIMDQTN